MVTRAETSEANNRLPQLRGGKHFSWKCDKQCNKCGFVFCGWQRRGCPVGAGRCFPSSVPNIKGKAIPPKLYDQLKAKEAEVRKASLNTR